MFLTETEKFVFYRDLKPKRLIIQLNPQYLLRFWDLRAQKLYVKTLIKLTPGVRKKFEGVRQKLNVDNENIIKWPLRST